MAFVIPTTFLAFDRFSKPVRGMITTTGMLTERLAIMGAHSERAFNRLPHIISHATRTLFEYAKGAALLTGAMFSGKSLSDYQDALASFHTIVSELNNLEFSKYETEIQRVARLTKKSTVEVAQSFEKIAGLNETFANTPEGIGDVAKAVITLARASRMELAPTAENLVGIMNQFSYGTAQANRTINALAAGQAVGAASIGQTAEALTNFGKVAAEANIDLERSIALIQVMAKFGQMGADAGHRLRSTLIKIQESGSGYKSGKFNIIDALEEIKQKYDSFSTEMARNNYLSKLFGEHQIAAGTILVNNIPLIKEYAERTTGTNEAFRAAEINAHTLSNRLEELKAKWVTLITTSENVNTGLGAFTSTVQTITEHLDGLTSAAGYALLALGGWWVINKIIAGVAASWAILSAAVGVYNGVMGVTQTQMQILTWQMGLSEKALKGFALGTRIASIGLWGMLGVVGLVAAGIGLIANKFSVAAFEARAMNDEIKLTERGIETKPKVMSDASIALDKYTQDLKDYYEEKKRQRIYDWEYKNTPGQFLFAHPLEYRMRSQSAVLPDEEDNRPEFGNYPGLDTTGQNKSVLDSIDKSFKPIIDTPSTASVGNEKIENTLKEIANNTRNIGKSRYGLSVGVGSTRNMA